MFTPPLIQRQIGCTVLCADEFGNVPPDAPYAVNALLQAVLDALPAKGGTLHVPAGTYWIDTAQPLRPKPFTRLLFDDGAVLRALPNSYARSQLLLLKDVTDIEVIGGIFCGERDSHTFQSGTTDEWDHAIGVYGAKRISILRTHLADWTGDGISIGRSTYSAAGSVDVFLDQVTSKNNRRQGLSIVTADGVLVCRSTFTGTHGTDPQCGIDIEPEKNQVVRNVRIVDCDLSDNARYGLNVLERRGTNPGGEIENVVVEDCRIQRNGSNGAYCDGEVLGLTLRGNTITDNSATGLVLTNLAAPTVVGNTSGRNYARTPLKVPRAAFDMAGWASKIERDILLRTGLRGPGLATNIGLNHYI